MRLAHVPLTSAGDTIDSGTFTAKENLKVVIYGVASSDISFKVRFNGATSNYAFRTSLNGGTDGTDVNEGYINVGTSFTGTADIFGIMSITNKSDKEKLVISECMATQSGAGNAPERKEVVGKWADTSNQITSITVHNSGSGDYASGSYITVFGATGDILTDEKDSLTNVPANTRYEETDTRKIFRAKSGKTWTESTQDNWWNMYENYYYGIKLGASFELNGETISQVKVWLKKSGSPTYNTTVEVIRGSTVEATSATVAMSTVTSTTGEWITYTFSSGVALQENDYIVFKQDGNQSSSNYVFVGNATKSGTVTTWWSNSPFSAQSHSGVIATMEVTSSTGMTWKERNSA